MDDKRTTIYRHKGKTTVLEEIIKAVIILKITAFIIVLFFMLLCFGLFILYFFIFFIDISPNFIIFL
ncbi:hypothetical protein CON87_33075 [Bacillus cereus]|nr:hypothetical protein CON87_33075 [Bacillus cereus]